MNTADLSFDSLRDRAERLHALMQDPQPGLMTWNGMVLDAVRDLRPFVESLDN